MDDASGYEPWRLLMWDHEIPMHWKRLADTQLREIIDQELAGKRKPREKWEAALSCYINHVASLVFCAREDYRLAYDIDLLADQLDYILLKGIDAIGRVVIPSYSLATAMHLLGGEKYCPVRQRLVRFTVSYPEHPFKIYTSDDLQAAELMLAAFGRVDDPVSVQLRQLIETSRPEVEQRQRKTLREHQHKQAVLNQMKA